MTLGLGVFGEHRGQGGDRMHGSRDSWQRQPDRHWFSSQGERSSDPPASFPTTLLATYGFLWGLEDQMNLQASLGWE